MRFITGRPGAGARGAEASAKNEIEELVVSVGDCASAWRRYAREAEFAFHRWQNAARGRRSEAATDYLQAIEREARAADAYRRVWEACCAARP